MFKKTDKKQSRESQRLPVYHLARYRYVSDPDQPMVIATVKDISETGMRCQFDRPVLQGSLMEFEVQFPFLDAPESCVVTVMWVKKASILRERYEAGLQFNGVKDFLTRALSKRHVRKEGL